jgi:hypothetical protein
MLKQYKKIKDFLDHAPSAERSTLFQTSTDIGESKYTEAAHEKYKDTDNFSHGIREPG